ncbi:MAG: transcriptional regulator [Bacteroidales bacterium]|nr:transcriptional regulator [Bacteroidales bacterium]
MFKELDPLLHSQLRLSIMSLLISVKSATFNFLLEKTGATRGNISVQLKKLEEAGYLEIDKSFQDNYPLTTCRITPKGIDAFERYVDALRDYLGGAEKA